jgi:hypothetical protein
MTVMDSTEERFDQKERDERGGRIERLLWLEQQAPNVKCVNYRGAISAKLFVESYTCFVYGQYLGSIVLALAFIEQSLGGAFWDAGRKELERAGLPELAREAMGKNWITNRELEALLDAWERRKSVTHHRKPGDRMRMEARAFYEGPSPFCEFLEKEARVVMSTMLKLLPKVTLCSASERPRIFGF